MLFAFARHVRIRDDAAGQTRCQQRLWREDLERHGGSERRADKFGDVRGAWRESVATDATGRIYVANGQVFVYGPGKKQPGVVDVLQRPLQVLLSGRTHPSYSATIRRTLLACVESCNDVAYR